MSDSSSRILNTAQLLTMIRRTKNFSRIDQALHNASGATEFCHYLFELMSARGLKAKDVIASTGMERSYFYHILSGKKLPSRNVVLRIGLCLEAPLSEVNKMLLLAEHGALYAKVRRDAALIYCIERKYTMKQANNFLKQLGEQPMYKD